VIKTKNEVDEGIKVYIKRLIKLVSISWMLIFFAPLTTAAVYKWVDGDGNVHFSDDPQDAVKGEEVNYDSLNVLEGGEDLANSASKHRERVLEQQEKALKASKEVPEETYDPCQEDLEAYDKLSRVHVDSNGVPFHYYSEGEDGTPLSQQEQDEVVLELGNDLERRGCL